MRSPTALALALSACGRLGFGTEQASSADGAEVDGALGLWSAPQPLSELNSSANGDDDPTLTGDMLEIFFDSSRPPASGGDIFTARRSSVSAPFGAVTIVAELASARDDTTPDVSSDGLTMYFSSDRATSGNRDIYRTTRPDRSSSWTAPVPVTELNTPTDDGGVIETADGLQIYFSSERVGANGSIYVASRTARGQPWGVPAPVQGLSDPLRIEDQHWINADATIAYFTAREGAAASEVMMASRSTPGDPFGPAVSVTIDTAAQESDPWVSPDQRTLVFASDRSGSFDLFISTR